MFFIVIWFSFFLYLAIIYFGFIKTIQFESRNQQLLIENDRLRDEIRKLKGNNEVIIKKQEKIEELSKEVNKLKFDVFIIFFLLVLLFFT